MARAARDAGFDVHVATHVDRHGAAIEAEGFSCIRWRGGAAASIPATWRGCGDRSAVSIASSSPHWLTTSRCRQSSSDRSRRSGFRSRVSTPSPASGRRSSAKARRPASPAPCSSRCYARCSIGRARRCWCRTSTIAARSSGSASIHSASRLFPAPASTSTRWCRCPSPTSRSRSRSRDG